MKKIAALALAGALTAGLTTLSQPAEAYGLKPTHCYVIGAGHSAPIVYRRSPRNYPAQFFVTAPGGTPTGFITVTYSGAAHRVLRRPVRRGAAFARVRVASGPLTVTFRYRGDSGFAGCSASVSTTIR